MGEVLTVLPFQNTLATFQISGKDLVASLESGVSEIEDGKGKFPQVAGLKYSFDKSVAPNAGRVKSVEVMEGGAWTPIDPAKNYIGRHQQLCPPGRRRLQALRRQRQERLRLRSGPRTGGRRLSDRATGPIRRSSTAASPRSPRCGAARQPRSRTCRADAGARGTGRCRNCRPARATSPPRRRAATPHRQRPRAGCAAAAAAPTQAEGSHVDRRRRHLLGPGAESSMATAPSGRLIADANQGYEPRQAARRRDADHPAGAS